MMPAESPQYATIPVSWDETAKTPAIGQRRGSFPGMLKERTFRVVWVSPDHGFGIRSAEPAGEVVEYAGESVRVSPGK